MSDASRRIARGFPALEPTSLALLCELRRVLALAADALSQCEGGLYPLPHQPGLTHSLLCAPGNKPFLSQAAAILSFEESRRLLSAAPPPSAATGGGLLQLDVGLVWPEGEQANGSPLQAPGPRQEEVPRWDGKGWVLLFRGVVVKEFDKPAPLQFSVLERFERERWIHHIPNPLPDAPDKFPKEQLHTAITKLNQRHVHPLIRFGGDGRGGVRWYRCDEGGGGRGRLPRTAG